MSNKIPWTSTGIGLLRQKESRLKARVGTGGDTSVEQKELSAVQARLATLIEAPSPSSHDTVATGHLVVVRISDENVRRKRGETAVFIMGGFGETECCAEIPIFAMNSVIGRAVLGKQIGDTVQVRGIVGGDVVGEIDRISLPEERSTKKRK